MEFAHEIEHAILARQLQNSGEDLKTQEYRLADLFRITERDFQLYLAERQAMAAEWTFLNAIPEVRRKELLDKVKKANDLKESWKAIRIRWIENASLPLEEYLKLEYAAHRYSLREIRAGRVAITAIGALIRAFAMGVPASIGVTIGYLECLERLKKQPAEKGLISEICGKFISVPVPKEVKQAGQE